jgi:tRNA (guanine-N7-)-methyltransferase
VLLKKGAEIHQKTDNMGFFEYSIEQFSDFGFTLKNISLDLHNSDFEGNIETEYEHRFASQGMPIYRLEAYLK